MIVSECTPRREKSIETNVCITNFNDLLALVNAVEVYIVYGGRPLTITYSKNTLHHDHHHRVDCGGCRHSYDLDLRLRVTRMESSISPQIQKPKIRHSKRMGPMLKWAQLSTLGLNAPAEKVNELPDRTIPNHCNGEEEVSHNNCCHSLIHRT